MLIQIKGIIAILMLLLFITIISMKIKKKHNILFYVFLLFFSYFVVFWGFNQEITNNIKYDKYEKIILYNECGMPQDTVITLKNK